MFFSSSFSFSFGVVMGWFLLTCVREIVTGILLAEAASTLLEDDVDLSGGVYTAACLGQPYIDRLDRGGFHIETKLLED